MKNLKGDEKGGGTSVARISSFARLILRLASCISVSFFFFYFFIIRGPDTKSSFLVYFISNEFERSVFPVLPPPSSFSIIPGDDLERMSTICVDSSPSRNNFFLSNGEGGGARLSPPCSPRVLLTFHASFPPIMTPFIFLEHTGNGRSISNESKSQIVVVFQREHNFTWSGFSFKKKKRKKERTCARERKVINEKSLTRDHSKFA